MKIEKIVEVAVMSLRANSPTPLQDVARAAAKLARRSAARLYECAWCRETVQKDGGAPNGWIKAGLKYFCSYGHAAETGIVGNKTPTCHACKRQLP